MDYRKLIRAARDPCERHDHEPLRAPTGRVIAREAPHRKRAYNQGVFDRITFDQKVMSGRACIRGMRIPVSVIVSQVAHGATFDEILQGYPDLERADIQEALEYAAWLTQEEVRIP